MYDFYDKYAQKKPVNLSINSDLLRKSKELKINLSATFEETLQNILAQKQAEQWRDKNIDAIHAYNDFIEENGTFSDEFRSF